MYSDSVDVNECSVNANICGTNGSCINTAGSYECFCDKGYVIFQNVCMGEYLLCVHMYLKVWSCVDPVECAYSYYESTSKSEPSPVVGGFIRTPLGNGHEASSFLRGPFYVGILIRRFLLCYAASDT